jgi:hypothetical protein
MKSLLGKLGVLSIGLLILGNSEVWGADWVFYGETDTYKFYYDKESISRPSKNIVEVSEKLIYLDKGVNFIVRELGQKYENLSHSITLWQIDCPNENFRFLSLTYYSKEEKIIYSRKLLYSSGPAQEWSPITKGTMGWRLYEAVCK